MIQPGDVVWIHDYQLMILPQLLRREQPAATIGFFLHIPFPSYELYRLLPKDWKENILIGILGADLIGFHTYDYAQHFIQSVKMILGLDNQYNRLQYQDRLIQVDLFPIGIDFETFKEASKNKKILEIGRELKKNMGDKKIIFSVDRLDYTKGLNYRLDGFEAFLEQHPEWKEKVVFILNIIPSRDSIAAYSDRKRMIEEQVSMINGKYSTLHWQPILYRYNHVSFEELVGLYQVANVALITPLRDGMNLVAKEYVASCSNGGVLILSELTGAASELNEAILMNPTDTEQMSSCIAQALSMPLDEQKERLRIMQDRLMDYDVVSWVNDFLDQLNAIKKEQQKQVAKLIDTNDFDALTKDYHAATKRCILLDYDGTLAPFTKIPSEATPDKRLINFLKDLTSDEKNEVTIISGRDSNTLDKWLGSLPLNFVSEHGVYIKYRGGDWEAQTTASSEWKNQIRPMLQAYVKRCVGSLMEEKTNSLSWHYRNTHPGLGFTRSRELLNNLLQLTANTPVQVIDGNKVIEVRLTGLNKGMTANKLLNHFKPDFTLCLGDDTTDEDMFKALEDKAYTIRIGNTATAANYNILSQTEVLPLLEKLIQQPTRKRRWLFTNMI
jgi:trehalose 6-phosphate synthase/phosphatase